MYVWPSVCPCSHVSARLPHWMDLREICYWGLWWKPTETLKMWLKSDKNIRQFTWRPKYILLLPATSIRLMFIFVQHSVLCCLQWHVAKQDTQNVLLRFSCNNDYANAPQCYVILLNIVCLVDIRFSLISSCSFPSQCSGSPFRSFPWSLACVGLFVYTCVGRDYCGKND